MERIMLKSKIHRGKITLSDINYEGSISIDKDLMEKADLLQGEKVLVIDIENGERFETYVIEAERGSREIGVNGGAARLVQKGDHVIIMSFASYEESELDEFRAKIVILNDANGIANEITRGI